MIFRWILSHSVIILVLIAILFAVWKVDDLHSWLPEIVTRDAADSHGSEVVAEVADEKPVKTSGEAVNSKPGDTDLSQRQNDADQAEAKVGDDRNSRITTHANTGQKAADGKMMQQGPVEDDDTDGSGHQDKQTRHSQSGNVDTAAPVIASIELEENKDTSTGADANEDTAKPDMQGNSMQKEMPVETASLSEQWLSARQAYWQQDLKQAEKQYIALRDMSPEDPDIVGELGNLYYARGDLQQAVETYYETGLLLRDTGRVQEAWKLANDMHRLDVNMANELRNQLEANGSRF